MKNLVLCITLNFIFFINIVYSVEVVPHQPQVHVQEKSKFNLMCNVSNIGNQQVRVEWSKDSKKVSDISGLKNRAVPTNSTEQYVLSVDKSTGSDSGNYSCIIYQGTEEKARANFTVVVTEALAVRVPSDVNVVEEERLRIECEVKGDPVLYWKYKNESYSVSGSNVILENYTHEGKVIRNGVFIIEKISDNDKGEVTCIGEDIATGQSVQDTCRVRVKGKYAALWPFLGICAEVIVLCAIIVIYEKKRNKTELEESDTDQSPDQKNTPDHGKEANLRHRQ
uniref:Basigin n=1 Tax=Anoplophora glabripennis TaxID=217634 RepID=V5GVB3_ANOGL